MQLPTIGWANLDGAGGGRCRDVGLGLRLELVDPLHAGARDRLIGADDDPPDPAGVVQRLERDDHLDRRAVGVGDDPPVLRDVVRVDLGDDQRNVGVHPEGARVVDDDRAGRRRDRAPLPRDARPACSTGRCRRPRTHRRESSRIGCVSPRNSTDLPALRAEARNLIDATGKRRSSSRRIIRSPTAPLAPTTATFFTADFPRSRSRPSDRIVAGRERFASSTGSTRWRRPISRPTIRGRGREIQASRLDRAGAELSTVRRRVASIE